ncbi:MAG: hypothetical protein HRT57_18090 [Crocinitomicaceae bacterium]|nr:hypothetical protein [Crocinitomicaceae bacterium]
MSRIILATAISLSCLFISGCIPGLGGGRSAAIPDISTSVDISYVESKKGESYDRKIQEATISLFAMPSKGVVKKFVIGINEKATWLSKGAGARNYAVTTAAVTYPESITGDFELRVDNKTQEVVSFAQVMVSMSVKGKMIHVDQDNYDDLRKISVAPGLSLDNVLITGGFINKEAGSPVKIQLIGVMVGSEKKNLSYNYTGGQRVFDITQENTEEVLQLTQHQFAAQQGLMMKGIGELNVFTTQLNARAEKYKTDMDMR